ncbi:threonine/homoserine/homoserine lactone efflux protein [Paraburkholderia eburnea]|uniref:Threonine/homoserine/homoserine lactone efflux protein n=1 Tax=Paraburkholderia eburnea TaxID=1189126 RepID=A0A2S4LUD5_9BURK|nr:LysE family translocator [Paraburkholderia eburnea]POR46048.1 threonine/homoserine/homoserine lactone efflux protein [Paraburkholderia eburnea]PRZ15748.1 threonine/homoserine/homoserine lactone efflux protein [Paraburkholderia eburnea]
MQASLLTAFWIVSFSLVMVPGADWAYAISAGLRGRVVAPAVGGMLLGYLAITLVVAAGVGTLVTSVPAVLSVLTVAGGAYLLWLGVKTLMRPASQLSADDGPGQAAGQNSRQGWALRGFAISGLNPKAILLFVALLPQFTRPGAGWSVSVQIVVLGALHMLNCASVYSVVGLGSKAVLSTRPKAARIVSQLSGAAMIVVAVLLFAEQVFAFARHT